MTKKTKDALKAAALGAGVVVVLLPGTWNWLRAKFMGTEAEKKKAEDWAKKTEDEFKKG